MTDSGNSLPYFGAAVTEIRQPALQLAVLAVLRIAADREAARLGWAIRWLDDGGHVLGEAPHRRAAEHLENYLDGLIRRLFAGGLEWHAAR